MSHTEEDNDEEDNKKGDLDELFILTAHDSNGVEGVASYVDPRDEVMKPALGGPGRVPDLLIIAQALANESGLTIRLRKWRAEPESKIIAPIWRDT